MQIALSRCWSLLVCAAVLSGSALVAHAEGHALVVGIARFADPAISALPGLDSDVAVATRIAQKLGVSRAGTVVLSDARATARAVREQLTRIARETTARDKVFIYFSTHGSRWMNDAIGKCDESLLFYDSEHITKDELAAMLKPIAEKAYKMLLFIDSCHSGNFTVARGGDRSLVAKFQRDTRVAETCEAAINDLADKISPVPPRSRGVSPNNVIVVTAARPNEYALHRVDIGGLATNAWAQCFFGKAVDEDRSGAISFAEVEACAQRDIDDELRSVREYKAHHIGTQGARALPLSLLTESAAAELAVIAIAPPVPPRPTVQPPAPPIKQEPIAPLKQVPSPPAKPEVTLPSKPAIDTPIEIVKLPTGPVATLHDIVAMSDGRWTLDVDVPNPVLQIQKDFFSVRVRSQHPGFVYMLAVGSDNKTVDILFPNRIDQNNTIAAGEQLLLPRAAWRLRSQGPAGTNHVVVLVSESARDLDNNSFEDLAGVFLRAKPEQSNTLQRGLYRSAMDGNGKCKSVSDRNAVVEAACEQRFAARLVEIREVMER